MRQKGLVNRRVVQAYYYYYNGRLCLGHVHTVPASMYLKSEKVLEGQKVFPWEGWWALSRGVAPEKMWNSQHGQTDLYLNQVFSSCHCQSKLWLRFGVFFTEAIYFQALLRVSILPVDDYCCWSGKSLRRTQPTEQELRLRQMCALCLSVTKPSYGILKTVWLDQMTCKSFWDRIILSFDRKCALECQISLGLKNESFEGILR